MKYIIYGGSGFLGSVMTDKLIAAGHEVVICDIRPPQNSEALFLKTNLLEPLPENNALEHPDVVINLAGKRIFGRWDEKFKQLIYDTRIVGTQHIVETFRQEKYRPQYLINASAVGVYGDHGEEVIDEASSHGNSFLSHVAEEWEEAAFAAKEYGVQVRILRNAHILGKGGLVGVLQPFYQWGIGGPLGSGKQWMPWIHIDDCADLYIKAATVAAPEICNAVAPEQVRNKTFSKTMAKVLHRPHLFFVPKFALKLLYGEFADEMLISQKVASRQTDHQEFTYTKLRDALQQVVQ